MATERAIRIMARGIDDASQTFEQAEENAREAAEGAEQSWSQAVQDIEDTLDVIPQTLKKVGQSLQQVGADITKKVTVPLATAGSTAATMSGSFREGFLPIQTMLQASEDRINRLAGSVLDAGSATGVMAGAARDAFQQIVSAGQRGQRALDTLNISLKSGKIFGSDFNTVTNILLKTMENFPNQVDGARDAMNTLIGTFEKGLFTFQELSQNFPRVQKQASALGVGLNEAAAAFAIATRSAGSTARASTQVAGIFRGLRKPTEDMQELFQDFGVVTGEELVDKLGGLSGVLQEVQRRVEGTDQTITNYFRNVRGMGGVQSLLNSGLEKFVRMSREISNSQGRLNDSWDAAQNKMGVLVDILRSKLLNLWRRFGMQITDLVVPVLKTLITWTESATEYLKSFSDEAKYTAAVMGALATAVGPTIWAIGQLVSGMGALLSIGSILVRLLGGSLVSSITFMVNPLAGLATTFFEVASGINLTTAATTALLPGLSTLATTLALLAPIVFDLEDAFPVIERFDQLLEEMIPTSLLPVWRYTFGALPEIVKTGMAALELAVEGGLSGIEAAFVVVSYGIQGEWQKMSNELREITKDMVTKTHSVITSWGIEHEVIGISAVISSAIAGLTQFIFDSIMDWRTYFDAFVQHVEAIFGTMGELMIRPFVQYQKMMQGVFADIFSHFERIMNWINSAAKNIPWLDAIGQQAEAGMARLAQSFREGRAEANQSLKSINQDIKRYKETADQSFKEASKATSQNFDNMVKTIKKRKQEVIKQLNELNRAIEQSQSNKTKSQKKDEKNWSAEYEKILQQRKQRLQEQLAKYKSMREQKKNHAKETQNQVTKNLREEGVNRKRIYQKLSRQSVRALRNIGITSQDTMLQLKRIAEKFKSDFTNSIVEITKTGEFEWKNMVDNMLRDLQRLATQKLVTDPIMDALWSGISGGINSWMGGGGPSQVGVPIDTGGGGAGRFFQNQGNIKMAASGANVSPGETYVVGEEGPELFHAGASGRIIPNDKVSAAGGGGVTINQTIQVTTGVQQTVRAEIQNLMPEIQNKSKAAVMEAISRGGSAAQTVQGA